MSMPVRTFATAILPVLLVVLPAAARAADEDAQAWLTAGVRTNLVPQVDVAADVSQRLSDDRGGRITGIVRGTISYRINDSISVESYFGRFASYEDGAVTQRELRLAQHLVWRMGEFQGGRWTARSRFEQRLVDGANDTGFRLRQRIAYRRPITEALHLSVASEAYFSLKDTDFGSRAGFEGLRNTAAVTVPVTEGASLDLGYLNQWTQRAEAPDTMVHAATVTLTIAL